MRSITAPTLLVMSLACTGLSARADDIPLKWSFKEGDVFYTTTEAKNDVKIELMGNTIPQKQTMKFIYRFKVKSVKENAPTMEITTLLAEMDLGLPGGGAMGEKLKGAVLTATFDEKLEVTKLEGYDKYLDRVSGGDKAQKKILQSVLSEQAMKQTYGQLFVGMPGKAVAVDAKWNQTGSISVGGMFDMIMKRKFTLEGESGGIARIKETGDVTFKPAAGGGGGLPFKFSKIDLKSDEYKASHKFDTRLGRMKESKVEMKITGTMTVSVNGMELEMGMKMQSNSSSEFTDKNPANDD